MRLLIFGPGYTAGRVGAAARARGWDVAEVSRETFETATVEKGDFVLSSVPPEDDGDAVLVRHGEAIARAAAWVGYLSSTGVYGDTGGAWVDESAAIGAGRRSARAAADLGWQRMAEARVFRLPGIYGPGRSVLDALRSGRAHRIAMPGQVFSRIHVEDIVGAVLAAFEAPPGIYNIADDRPAAQAEVVGHGAALLGMTPPPLQTLDEAGLSPQGRAFSGENRRVANGKAKRVLGWRPLYPTFVEGLARDFSATTVPMTDSKVPASASADQR